MSNYNLKHGRVTRKTFLIVCAVLLLGLGAGAFAARQLYGNNLKPVSSSQKSIIFTVESGATAKQIADELKEKELVRESWAFQWYVRDNDLRDKLQAGSYALKPSLSIPQIADILSKGSIATDLVTILPGKRIDEIRDHLINDGFDAVEVEAALEPEQYEGHPALVDKPAGDSLEGYLYPETFQRTATTKPSTIIAASLDQMQSHLTPKLRAGIVAKGLTAHQGIILASIIEREVSDRNPGDKAKVAQVFLKRLQVDMLLQSDATASYGAILDNKEPSLTYDSAYNTYIHKGLPPTPISNVTKTSLEAVANPADTDYLYFVSGDDENNYFSKTIEEHEANVQAHCKKKCGR